MIFALANAPHRHVRLACFVVLRFSALKTIFESRKFYEEIHHKTVAAFFFLIVFNCLCIFILCALKHLMAPSNFMLNNNMQIDNLFKLHHL